MDRQNYDRDALFNNIGAGGILIIMLSGKRGNRSGCVGRAIVYRVYTNLNLSVMLQECN